MAERTAGDGAHRPSSHLDVYVQAAALRAEFPRYAVNVLGRRGSQPRFEVVHRDGGNPYCLISPDALEIWRELIAAGESACRPGPV